MHSTIKKTLLVLPLIGLPLAALVFSGCTGDKAAGNLSVAGSTTVQPVAEKLAAAYMRNNPDVTITVQGGGSSVGVKSAANGVVDIGAASRELKPSEPALVTHLLARDGIAIIVHPDNPVTSISRDQVVQIYAGIITDWGEAGGSGDITVFSREEGSGTRDAFEELVMGLTGPAITSKAILQPSNGAIRTSVSTTPLAIGYLSLGYIDNTVKVLELDGIACNAENCNSGKYPVVRPLYFLTRKEPTGLTREFIDFCLSTQGQDIIEQEGYLSAR